MAKSPMYLQIADDLRRRIGWREFAADTRLPTEACLREEYRASRNTVREAIKLLTQERLLETRVGQGTFVTEKIVPFVTTLSTDPQAEPGGGEEGATYPALVLGQGGQGTGAGTPEVMVLKCPARIAERLRVQDEARVVSRHQQRFIDRAIWSLQTSYYPLEWVTMGAAGLLEPADIDGGAVAYLARTIGLKQVGYRDSLSARLPNDKERSLFNLMHNQTVIEIYRTSFAEDQTPIRVTVTVFPSDRNQLVYEIGAVPDGRVEPVQSQ